MPHRNPDSHVSLLLWHHRTSLYFYAYGISLTNDLRNQSDCDLGLVYSTSTFLQMVSSNIHSLRNKENL